MQNYRYASTEDLNGSNLLTADYYEKTKDLSIDVGVHVQPEFIAVFAVIGTKNSSIGLGLGRDTLTAVRKNNIEKLTWNSYEVIVNGEKRFYKDDLGIEIDFVKLKSKVDDIEEDLNLKFRYWISRNLNYRFKVGDRIEGTVDITVQKENKTEERKIKFNSLVMREKEYERYSYK
jgi:hypothetical protein